MLCAIGGCIASAAALVIALATLTGLDEEASPSSITTGGTRTGQQRIEDSYVPLNGAIGARCSVYADWNADQATSTTVPGANEPAMSPSSFEAAQEANVARRMKDEAWRECGIWLILDIPAIDYDFYD